MPSKKAATAEVKAPVKKAAAKRVSSKSTKVAGALSFKVISGTEDDFEDEVNHFIGNLTEDNKVNISYVIAALASETSEAGHYTHHAFITYVETAE